MQTFNVNCVVRKMELPTVNDLIVALSLSALIWIAAITAYIAS